MASDLTYLEAAEIVLKEVNRPLSTKELIREIQQRRLFDIGTRTPLKSMNARLSVDINKRGNQSKFKRVGPGEYVLRDYPAEEYKPEPHRKKIRDYSKVLVFPSHLIDEIGHFHGIRRDYEVYFDNLVNIENSFPMSRRQAEGDPNFKQVVSYVLIKYRDSVLRFTRGVISTIGDYFIGQYSIGFGGHVEGSDWNLFSYRDRGYSTSVERELLEEVGIVPSMLSPHNFRMVGVLNDDSTELGRRHFAFIHLLELPEPKFRKGEISINDLKLIDIPDLSVDFAGYEYWSKLCIQTYFGERLAIGCYIHPKPDFSLNKQSDLILVTGYIGSGKTEACNLFSKEFLYVQVPCSKILQNLIGCAPMEEIGRQKMQDLGYEFVNQPGGHERYVEAIFNYMMMNKGTKFVFDGLRYPKTLELLHQKLAKPITVIYIESTIDNLYQYHREREASTCSFIEFLDLIRHPVEREIERFYPIADITIYNHGTKEVYLGELMNYLKLELR